ncbi:hypothetical protein CN108_03075 [Sinorhizobium meliloti]|nr:hypothetical protein CN108_03075 [Sinorhizobium meliloti]
MRAKTAVISVLLDCCGKSAMVVERDCPIGGDGGESLTKVGATGREIVYVACRCAGGGYTHCRLFLPCGGLR